MLGSLQVWFLKAGAASCMAALQSAAANVRLRLGCREEKGQFSEVEAPPPAPHPVYLMNSGIGDLFAAVGI